MLVLLRSSVRILLKLQRSQVSLSWLQNLTEFLDLGLGKFQLEMLYLSGEKSGTLARVVTI